jgi:biopolymer transport protein TolQ
LADVLYRVAEQQVQALERQIAVLGSLGATAPFVGLLGTVLGIITTLHDMGQQGHVTIATIAPGISDALVSTALGLAVAIPAVLMYNGFRRRAERLRDDLEAFRLEALYVLMDQLKHEGAT